MSNRDNVQQTFLRFTVRNGPLEVPEYVAVDKSSKISRIQGGVDSEHCVVTIGGPGDTLDASTIVIGLDADSLMNELERTGLYKSYSIN